MIWKSIVCLALVVSMTALGEAGKLPPSPPATPGVPGSILAEYFRGVAGAGIGDLTGSAAYPLKATDSELLKTFEVAVDDASFGSLVRGYITPPTTGNYTFWVAADDAGELYLSTDESPENRRKICECPMWVDARAWNAMPKQKSQPIALAAGKRYYIEALHKQAEGGSHLSVGWQLPDGTKELPIPGNRLTPAGKAHPQVQTPVLVKLDPKTPVATAPGQHKFPNDATIERNSVPWKMSYLIHLPKNYDKTTDRKPMFVFLCGNSHQGTDLGGILNEGPAQYLNDIPKLNEYFPFVGLFPQPPDNMRWDSPGMAEAVVGLVDEIVKKYRVDPDRVYLSGLSMGGKGTWLVAEAAPDRFAAISPMCAVSVRPEKAGEILRYLPAWIICGSDDGPFTDGSKEMAKVIKAAGGSPQLTVFPNEGHGVWGRYYPEPKFYDWLLKHKRTPEQAAKSRAATQPAN